jgi:hypothetical protein
MEQVIERKDLIDQQIEVFVPEWSLGPIVEALQTLHVSPSWLRPELLLGSELGRLY